ncbi:unnamed protein product [Adineta ricciae]|uniref:Uncharacterized protein n=1 Tax=Adineta ricciae TaxID=249248 RepID=A0A815SDN9_ADIRI|nr:unnamed protein product [Adineta ricciae]CAF1490576.1 unnamed protein product [Adineta ricciae]
MSPSKHSRINTTTLPSNILDLRDEAFYDFVRQVSGKRVAELLAFQELNGVDSFLGCQDVTAVLRLQSDQLNELKKHTCIILVDGTIPLLPGLGSSINILTKLLKKNRDEINKRAVRLQSFNSSFLPIASSIPIVHSAAITSPGNPLTHAHLQSASLVADTSTLSVHNPSHASNSVPGEISNRISTNITDWLKKKEHDLNLISTDFQQGIDFHIELNEQRDGIIIRCKCGARSAVSQKQGTLVFSNVFRHFKSGKCSLIIEKQQNPINRQSTANNEVDDGAIDSTLLTTTQWTLPNSQHSGPISMKSTSSKGSRRTRSTSIAPKNKRQRRK